LDTKEGQLRSYFLYDYLITGVQKMSKKRRNHSPEFKSKVALAALKGDKALAGLSQQYGINSNLIVKWACRKIQKFPGKMKILIQ